MKKSLVTAAFVLAMLPVAAFAQAPDPSQVHIQSITANGNGCPLGSMSTSVSPDAKAFTLFFDQYIASAGPGIPITEKNKVCQINVDLRFPGGYSYSVISVDYRGYASLERGAVGRQRSEYWIQGVTSQRKVYQSTFYGPKAEDYLLSDRLGVGADVWSPCGATRALNISSRVTIEGGRGLLTVDSIDGEVSHIYGLRWRKC